MKMQNLSNKQSIKTGALYGSVSMAAIWLSGLLTLDSSIKYTGNVSTTACTFGILICGIVLCCKMLNRVGHGDRLPLGQLILAGIFFSLTAGLTGGLIHYINAAFIDTNWAQNALKASQAKWIANNYSKEAIAGQVEWTDTFQNPWKWAVVSGIFMIISSLFLFVTAGFFYNLISGKEKRIEAA